MSLPIFNDLELPQSPNAVSEAKRKGGVVIPAEIK